MTRSALRLKRTLPSILLAASIGALGACGQAEPLAQAEPETPAPVEAAPAPSPEELAREAIRQALLDYVGRDSLAGLAESGLPSPRFAYAPVDLDGDGRDEALAYLLGSIFCGSGGCDLLMLQQGEAGWEVQQAFPITQTPVALGPADEAGWRTLLRMEAGGGAPMSVVVHGFAGGEYVEQARLEAMPADAETVLGADTDYTRGHPLDPGADAPAG